jgi:hypothetical protein
MTDLSPAAKAVLDAFFDADDSRLVNGGDWIQDQEAMVAAALRAAAEKIEDLYCESDVDSADGVVFAMRQLVLIANELEDL